MLLLLVSILRQSKSYPPHSIRKFRVLRAGGARAPVTARFRGITRPISWMAEQLKPLIGHSEAGNRPKYLSVTGMWSQIWGYVEALSCSVTTDSSRLLRLA